MDGEQLTQTNPINFFDEDGELIERPRSFKTRRDLEDCGFSASDVAQMDDNEVRDILMSEENLSFD